MRRLWVLEPTATGLKVTRSTTELRRLCCLLLTFFIDLTLSVKKTRACFKIVFFIVYERHILLTTQRDR